MIVLVNPAIEGVRYSALFEVANRHRSRTYQPPLLVSITTYKDRPTRLYFPAGRFIYSVFERPVSSDLLSWAVDHTYGHVGLYMTHHLYWRHPSAGALSGLEAAAATDDATCPGWEASMQPEQQNRQFLSWLGCQAADATS